jgi:hypothetical protein
MLPKAYRETMRDGKQDAAIIAADCSQRLRPLVPQYTIHFMVRCGGNERPTIGG